MWFWGAVSCSDRSRWELMGPGHWMNLRVWLVLCASSWRDYVPLVPPCPHLTTSLFLPPHPPFLPTRDLSGSLYLEKVALW